MSDKKYLITNDGLRKLEEELEYLKTIKRKEVTEKIKVARGYGDLSENSEYDEAKNEQAFVEGRIAEIENKLKNPSKVNAAQIPHAMYTKISITTSFLPILSDFPFLFSSIKNIKFLTNATIHIDNPEYASKST